MRHEKPTSRHSELELSPFQERIAKRSHESQTAHTLREKTRDTRVLYRFLRLYTGVEVPLEETPQPDVYRIKVGKTRFDQLPDGYVYKGGVARAVLEEFLKIHCYAWPRDIDIAVLPGKGSEEMNQYVAQQYMPEDYQHGHGVEELDDDYFSTRDFTINELYYDGEYVYVTRQCLLDTVRSVLRITEYEKQERYYDEGEYFVKPKLLAKALRFLAQKKIEGYAVQFANEEAIEWIGVDYFHMALHLDRALEQGHVVAQQYVYELKKRALLPEDIDTVEKAVAFLSEELYDFVFKHHIPEQDALDETIDKWAVIEDAYLLPFQEGMGRRPRKKQKR